MTRPRLIGYWAKFRQVDDVATRIVDRTVELGGRLHRLAVARQHAVLFEVDVHRVPP